ncbi:hypothetical protein [Rossellomorea aquimaris]|uniref:hypothetical protein n=1 Tax=Rossellomorea aquimaris TaxID=189382 RepID=UPI0006977F1D|nr:hypothetical protein [Rossellomorea aquimaris]
MNEVITEKEMTKMKKTILKNHEENELDICSAYGVTRNDIMTGVRCENCHYIPMKRIYASWLCIKCNTSSKYAHLNAILDYFLLIDKHITNRELRNFIHLSSRTTAYKLLKEFQMNGERKSAFYCKPGQ